MKAVIYCRVSTKEQAQNFSLGTQEKECRLWCERNGYAVDRIFIDAGESAKTANRPEFLRLLAHCRTNKKFLQVLVVHTLSRFSRNTQDHHAIRGLLLGFGITLRSVTEPTDDSPEGRFIEDMVAGIATYENRSKARRTRAAMSAALENGRWTFKAPIGYLNARSRTGPSLLEDPERGSLIRQAFKEFTSGCRTRSQVLDRVTALGLRTAKGARLSAQTFHAVLRNPIYAGQIVVPRLDVRAVGDFTPLVSQQVFDGAQALLSAKVKAIGPHLHNHPDFRFADLLAARSAEHPSPEVGLVDARLATRTTTVELVRRSESGEKCSSPDLSSFSNVSSPTPATCDSSMRLCWMCGKVVDPRRWRSPKALPAALKTCVGVSIVWR